MSPDPVVAGAVERLTGVVLDALTREAPTACAVRFLIRRYAATGREDVREALEPALTGALSLVLEAPREEQPGWLMLLGEAAVVSDDDRVTDAAVKLASVVQATWSREGDIATSAAGADACLRLYVPGLPDGTVQRAVDRLERLVAAAYQPGDGLLDAAGRNLRLADHVSAASALLTAFERTDRLPYSMLAEELMQFAARTFQEPGDAGFGFVDGETGTKPFAINCDAAAVLCRLAALHASEEYRRVAVVAAGADYGRDAVRLLRSLAMAAPELGLAGAAYGLAAADCHPVL